MKKLFAVLLMGLMMFALASCSEHDEYVGYWNIKNVQAGDVVMTESDINDMGLDAGYIKLTKKGNVEISLLGDEYEGVWDLQNGQAIITYGDALSGTVERTEEGITFTDVQGAVYKAERF